MRPLGIVNDGTITWDHGRDSYCIHTEKMQEPNTWKYTLMRRKNRIGDWAIIETDSGFSGWDVRETGLDQRIGHGFAEALAGRAFRTGLAVRRTNGIDYCTLG